MEKVKFINKLDFSAQGGPASGWDQLPKTSGVYFFYAGKELIYIGKAINIKNRVKNHFLQPSYRDNLFMDKVNKIGFIKTNSEIEALILEANLIKKHQPKFNVVWRDDKNYFYVAITKDVRPIVYITHQKIAAAEYIGPFVDGQSLKKILKYLRRPFPFYTQKNHPKNKCTWCHLDLCPGPNPDLKDYKKNIKKLILILQGKKSAVLNSLKKEMKILAKNKKFEEAGKVRDKIFALQKIIEHSNVLEKKNESPDKWETTQKILQGITNQDKKISRIECYDVSNIQGQQATGSMVVFIDGLPAKSQYKKFKIKTLSTPNDIAMLKEVFERRFFHAEWEYPQVILIDGGIAQLNVAISVIAKSRATKQSRVSANTPRLPRSPAGSLAMTVMSIAKGRQELFVENRKEPIPLKNLPQEIYNLVKNLDDEAHRFAITYHKKLRKQNLLN